jgi:three-Cys-motif partner protein
MAAGTKGAADHEFGSQATELKLWMVEAYLRFFTKALRGKFSELWYYDAFAGTGERTERVAARGGDLISEPVEPSVTRRRGSAKIAIDVEPPFDRLIFVEKRRRAVAALNQLRAKFPDRKIDVIAGDANEEIKAGLARTNWRTTRAVMFLDPYGMTVDWDTLKAIAATQAIDVWYLFSLSGLYRQAARSADAIDGTKRAAITRNLGTDQWEKELYAPPAQGTLLDDPVQLQRTADVRGLENYVRARLQTIFAAVLPPQALPIETRPQRFSLFFAIANRNPAAIGLATKIANHILKAGISSHTRS